MAEMSKYARAVRSYEISIWTLQDRFLSVLKWATQDHKGQIQEPEMTIRDDGTQELSFIIPKFYWVGANKIQNPMWLHLEDQPLEANMHKLKVIFNKNSSDEEVFEFLVTEVTHDHSEDRVELTVKAEGLAYHELGKIGYKISLSQETFTTAFDEWVDGGMVGDQPQENLQFWNDLIFKNSKGQWKGNWKYEIQMDWSSYSYQGNRETNKVYEDEYVSSWQVENGKLSPRAVEVSKEKWRPVEVKESNLYNITQTIAEEFGIFCRYEYEHDENYQLLPESRDENGNPIPTRKVVYYNNFYYDTDGHIDLTYPYSSNAITRTVDNSNIVTKMYVPQVEYEDETITIMDVEANKSKEDYLLDFEYLHNIQAITDEQYAEIDDYEAAMHTYNSTLFRIQERIRVLENQLIDTSARVTTLTNALKLDEEQESEAARLLRGIRGGSEDIPISTILTVMTGEGTNSDWYQYVTVTRWQGLNPESIHLYENSDTKMGYTDSIGFIVRRDENGEISHLTNLVRTADDSQVYIQATYNPYDYYKRMIERWKTREVLDEQDLAAAELEEAKINWYLHGNRVGYGIVGGIIMGDATYPVGVTMYDEPWPEEDLSRSDRTGEMRIVGTNEEAAEWQAADPPKPDPFADIDLIDTTPDLYYNLAYYLEEKAAYFNAFEKMMGPAMREGYWQPDNYHDYGDQYHDNITISKVAGGVPQEKPSPTTPYVQWKWDYEKYYTNETPVLYRVGVDAKPNAHLIIDISGCLDVIREHLDDLSFIYVDPATIYAVDALEDEIASLKEGIENETCNLSITDSDSDPLRKNTHLCWLHYDEANDTHTTYFNSIPDKSNENFEPLYTSVLPEDLSTDSSEATETTVDKVTQATEEWRIGLKALYENLNNSITQFAANYDYNNPVYTFKGEELDLDVINARLEELTDLQDQYQNVILNENNDNKPKIEKYSARITWCQNQIKLIQQVYDSISEYIFAPLSRAEAWIPRSIETLKDNIYNIYQIGADCELGWVRISKSIQDESGKIINSEESRPVLFVTGASGLSDDELNYIMTGYYAKEKLDVTEERFKDAYTYIGDEYAPFLGLYNVEINDILNEDGSVQTKAQISVEKLYKIPWAGEKADYYEALKKINPIFIDGLRRNNLPSDSGLRAVMQDYDGTGAKRWIKDEEYSIRRIFPRIYFSTLKLKNNSSDLKILLNKVLLENNTHYYTVQDDRSTGLKVQGIGYYTTLKPEVIYRMAGNIGDIQLVYTVSNVDTAIYLDALKVMHENATPKISYDVELSILNPNFIHTAYKRLNQIVYINDNDLNLDEVSGYISAVTMKLDKPWEDQVEVKNYETKFEDLFSTIVAQTEAMKKSQGGITAALQAFSTNGLINSDILQDSLINTDLNLSFDSGDGELSISKQGIIGESSSGIVAYRGGGIFTATTKDSNGNWIWNTGIVPSGINANLITAGQLNTNLIKIYAGDEIRFQFNGDGLFAYKPFVIADKDMAAAINKVNYEIPTNGIDSSQYVVYNSDGLALVAKEGTWYKVPGSNYDEKGQITNTWEYDQTTVAEIKRVEISWNGLILRNWNNEEVFYADPDTGNLTLKGQIEATSGKIAGWTIGKDGLRSKHITIISDDQSAGIYLTRDRGAGDTRSIEYVEEIEGKVSSFKQLDTPITFYGYTCKIEDEETGNEEIIRCYYPLGPDESTPPLSFKYSTDSARIVYQIENTIVQVRPKYTKTNINETLVVDEEDQVLKYGAEEIKYDGYGLSGPVKYNEEEEPKNWYAQLRKSKQDSYINYFYNEVARPISGIKDGTVITLVDFEPTFQVRASDGEAIINKGTFGTLIADDSGMSGVLTQIEFSLDNYMMARTSESKYERVELGRCFYDSVYNKSTGKLTLKRLDGTTVTYKIGTGSGTSGGGSSSTTTCNDCTTNCNQNCATGCAFECGKQCASSCAGTCSGTCKGTCTNKVSGR